MLARACMRAYVRDVFALYDNNIFTRLIMLKIIFLYFIEIAHTDDFPAGTRLVYIKTFIPVVICRHETN